MSPRKKKAAEITPSVEEDPAMLFHSVMDLVSGVKGREAGLVDEFAEKEDGVTTGRGRITPQELVSLLTNGPNNWIRDHEHYRSAVGFAMATGADIEWDALSYPDVASYYDQEEDSISYLPPEVFALRLKEESALHASVYGIFHELAHWTGHQDRLARLPVDGAEDDSADRHWEELVAGMAGAQLFALLVGSQEEFEKKRGTTKNPIVAIATMLAESTKGYLNAAHPELAGIPPQSSAEIRNIIDRAGKEAKEAVKFLLRAVANTMEESAEEIVNYVGSGNEAVEREELEAVLAELRAAFEGM